MTIHAPGLQQVELGKHDYEKYDVRPLSTAGAAGLASPWLTQSVRGAERADRDRLPDSQAKQAKLNEVLRQPVLKKELFKNPIIIESVELLKWENSYLCRVRSADGAEGIL